MKEKDELLQIFPTPVLITKYDGDMSGELKYIENLEYISQEANKNFKFKYVVQGCVTLSVPGSIFRS